MANVKKSQFFQSTPFKIDSASNMKVNNKTATSKEQRVLFRIIRNSANIKTNNIPAIATKEAKNISMSKNEIAKYVVSSEIATRGIRLECFMSICRRFINIYLIEYRGSSREKLQMKQQ